MSFVYKFFSSELPDVFSAATLTRQTHNHIECQIRTEPIEKSSISELWNGAKRRWQVDHKKKSNKNGDKGKHTIKTETFFLVSLIFFIAEWCVCVCVCEWCRRATNSSDGSRLTARVHTRHCGSHRKHPNSATPEPAFFPLSRQDLVYTCHHPLTLCYSKYEIFFFSFQSHFSTKENNKQ